VSVANSQKDVIRFFRAVLCKVVGMRIFNQAITVQQPAEHVSTDHDPLHLSYVVSFLDLRDHASGDRYADRGRFTEVG
jgi:hypothetical protein